WAPRSTAWSSPTSPTPPRCAGWPAGATTSFPRARSPSSAASSSRRSSGCSGRARGPVHGGPMADTEHGRITDEGIAKLRARIGQGFPGRRPWRTEVTRDAIYHLALAIGDLSPLYLDADLEAGPEKESTCGGGRARYQTYEAVYSDQDGRRVGLRNDTWIRIERTKTREKKKYGEIALAQWTPANIARLQDEYRRQTRTTERYWDDVKVGDPLGPLLKGPLTPTAEIAFESFFGIYLVGNIVAARLSDKH